MTSSRSEYISTILSLQTPELAQETSANINRRIYDTNQLLIYFKRICGSDYIFNMPTFS